MWCWLEWFWSRACYCCSAWHWSAVAGTSPSDAPRDQPDLVPYSSLWRPEGEHICDSSSTYSCHYVGCCCFASVCLCVREKQRVKEMDGITGGRWEALNKTEVNSYEFISASVTVVVSAVVCLISPRLLSLDAGAAVGQGHRPEHFRVSSFPVRHACCSSLHCNTNKHTHARALTYTDNMKRGHKVEVKWVIVARQIKYSWAPRLYVLMQNLRPAPKCTFQPLLARKVRNSDPKDKA